MRIKFKLYAALVDPQGLCFSLRRKSYVQASRADCRLRKVISDAEPFLERSIHKASKIIHLLLGIVPGVSLRDEFNWPQTRER